MSGIRYSGLGPDDATFASAVRGDGPYEVGIQLLGIRFTIDPATAREIAAAIVDICDAIETPGGMAGLVVLAADEADKAAVHRAVEIAQRRARQ